MRTAISKENGLVESLLPKERGLTGLGETRQTCVEDDAQILLEAFAHAIAVDKVVWEDVGSVVVAVGFVTGVSLFVVLGEVVDEVILDGVPVDEMMVGHVLLDEMVFDEVPVDEMMVGEVLLDEMVFGDAVVDEMVLVGIYCAQMPGDIASNVG